MLWVGQFGIEDGEAREQTPWVGAFREPSHTEDGSDLYLILEPALPGSDEFCSELKEAIGTLFHREKLSLTGGVLRAFNSAHENLREWNRKSIKEHRVAAGISCLVLHGNEGYLAQVAPAAAFHYEAGGNIRSLEPRLPDALEPLGLYDEFRPDFSRFNLHEGDRLLLLSPGLAEVVAEPDLRAVLSLPGEDALPALYRHARSLPNCAALLVASGPNGDPQRSGETPSLPSGQR